MNILRCEALTKTYGSADARVQALREVSLSFEQGTFNAIIG